MLKKLGEDESKRVLTSLKRKSIDFESKILFVATAGRQSTSGLALPLWVGGHEDGDNRILSVQPASVAGDRLPAELEDPTYKGSYVAVLAERIENVDEIRVNQYFSMRVSSAPPLPSKSRDHVRPNQTDVGSPK